MKKKENTKKEKNIKKILYLFFIIIAIILMTNYFKTQKIISKIGRNLAELYKYENVSYEENDIKKNKKTLINKRLNNKVYYEARVENGKEEEKYIIYSDTEAEKNYNIQENDKIAISDNIPFKINISEGYYLQMPRTKAEKYCFKEYIGKNMGLQERIEFKKIRSKNIDGKECYEVTVKVSDGIETTYFDKETLLPIKYKLENSREVICEKEIIIMKDCVKEEEIKLPNKYTIMKWEDFLEYQKNNNSQK